ncbi:MAG: hypothetical protein J0H79_13455 [Alphaproteobacteria bacterium]|nr:hypothetical protein [Alphaproteobacteria bacterium]
MPTLKPNSIRLAIRHIVRFGDTDIFPPLPGIAFLKADEQSVVNILSKVEPGAYTARTAINSLAPKGRLGFRNAQQLGLTDSILLLASVIEIGPEIERLRLPIEAGIAFSYRFKASDGGEIFETGHSYRDWMLKQQEYLKANKDIKIVLYTDISDFYQRIYTHRLEGFFGQMTSSSAATAFIVKIVKAIRGKESFGLPVGGAAARLLAELSLRDVDRSLFDEGITFTRYVDDYRLFFKDDNEVYDTLAFLAQALQAEGLTLNSAKTKLKPAAECLKDLKEGTADMFSVSQESAIAALTASLYDDVEPTDDEIAALHSLNLIELLENELAQEEIDFAKVRKVLRGIRVASPETSLDVINEHFHELLPMAKEIVLILDEASKTDQKKEVKKLKSLFVKYYNEPPARNIPILRAWLMEAFVRGIFPVDVADLKSLNNISTALDARQNYLLQGLLDRRTIFRNKKYELDTVGSTDRLSFLLGAMCLPKEELKPFLDTAKKSGDDPLLPAFCNWLLQ